MPEALLPSPDGAGWLRFSAPVAVFSITRLAEVRPALRQVEREVEARRLHAVGFVSYEAAPAFDPALSTRPAGEAPLLWFGLFPPPQRLAELPPEPGPSAEIPLWLPDLPFAPCRAGVETVRELIGRGETYQVNLTLGLAAILSGHPLRLFRQLLSGQPSPFAGYLDTGTLTVCSASPELFFRLDGHRIVTRPMKGTAPRGCDPEEDRKLARRLFASAKERAENLMIVDMLRNDLGRIASPGSIRVERLFQLERHPTLWQMTSTVSARTAAGLEEIFAALFPCASVTGAPKVRTMEIIAALEKAPRGIYTGSLGHLAPGRQATFNVAIRTATVDRRGRAAYGVGSGLTWDSEPVAEFAECLLKARILDENGEDFELLETLLWTPEDGFFLLPEHRERLRRTAEHFGFPLEAKEIDGCLAAATHGLEPRPHRVRLLVDRRGGVRCEAFPLPAAGPDAGAPVRVALSPFPVDSGDSFLRHKTTRRAVYRRALAATPGADEVILWNEREELTEAATANLVIDTGHGLFTPPEGCGLLPGTFRRRLLEEGRIRERVLYPGDLATARGIFLVNSVRRWRRAELISIACEGNHSLERTASWNSF